MLCLYCGNRLSLLRKLKGGEFCSEKHRDLYDKEQTELALARLTESGNRIAQPRRPVETVEAIEKQQEVASSGEDLNLPEPVGFLPEPPAQYPPGRPRHSNIEAGWMSVTAMPPRFEAAEAKLVWEPLGYCMPALTARTGAENARLGGEFPQAEFKPAQPRLPVTALALDLSQPVRREAPERYRMAPPVPIPMRYPARPVAAPPRSLGGLAMETWPPAVVSHLGGSSGLTVLKLGAAPPPIGTLLDGPFQPLAGTGFPAAPSARLIEERALGAAGAHRLPASAGLLDPQLRPALCRLEKPGVAAGTIGILGTGTHLAAGEQHPVRLPGFLTPAMAAGMRSLGGHLSIPVEAAQPLVIAAEAAGAFPLEATRRLPTLAWSPATTAMRDLVVLGAYMPRALPACSIEARAPEVGGALDAAPLRLLPAGPGLADAGLPLALCRLPKPGPAAGAFGFLNTSVALATGAQYQLRLPGFVAPAIPARMRSLGGHVSMPLAAAPLDTPTGAAGEFPAAVTHRLPDLSWSAATPRLRAEMLLSAYELATHLPMPRPMAGANRVSAMASRARGGRKVAARMWLPTANLPLPGPRLSHGETWVPPAAPEWSSDTRAALIAPLPEIHTFIPSRRRPELKARIMMPSAGGFVRCQGMALPVKLRQLGTHLASVEDPRLAATGAARFMDWTSFPAPATPSPEAISGQRILQLTPASVRPLRRLFPVSLTNLRTVVGPVKPAGATAPHTICRAPRLPSFGTAQDGAGAHERTSALLSDMVERLDGAGTRWAISRLWRRAPVSAKGLVAGIVLLGALTMMGNTSSAVQWNGLREDIRSRAAVDLVDDFRAGMGAWDGVENWAETWSYDNAGFVQTGNLALYRPSMTLNDYRFEFLGQIANRGMGWVFRAVDTRNYYAMKVVFTNSGPTPKAAIVRYAVIDGKPGPKTQLPLPMEARTDMMSRIRVDVVGSNFTAQFQDQVVDVWSDNRLAAGGVGFFSDKGEQAKIRWIEITHQSDFLGKLCAYLVPYDARSANRSLTR